jgi:TldD protein
MGEKPTGNARATGYRHPPIVRMTNMFIEEGKTPSQEMIGDIELGVYACDAFGGQTTLENLCSWATPTKASSPVISLSM